MNFVTGPRLGQKQRSECRVFSNIPTILSRCPRQRNRCVDHQMRFCVDRAAFTGMRKSSWPKIGDFSKHHGSCNRTCTWRWYFIRFCRLLQHFEDRLMGYIQGKDVVWRKTSPLSAATKTPFQEPGLPSSAVASKAWACFSNCNQTTKPSNRGLFFTLVHC